MVLFALFVVVIFPPAAVVSPAQRAAAIASHLGLTDEPQAAAASTSNSRINASVPISCSIAHCSNVVEPSGASVYPFCWCGCPPEYCGLFCEQQCPRSLSPEGPHSLSASAKGTAHPLLRDSPTKANIVILARLNYGLDQPPVLRQMEAPSIPYMASSFRGGSDVDGEVVKTGVLISCDGAVQEAVTPIEPLSRRQKIAKSFPHYFPNTAAIPSWIADWDSRARNHKRLLEHNTSSMLTYEIEASPETNPRRRVFCAFSARIGGVGHYFHDLMTVLGKFLYLYGNESQALTLVFVDPQHCPGRLCGDLVYWPLHFLNVSVVFLPRHSVLRVDEATFVKAEETPTPWSVAFLRDVIWPRVKQRYAGYPKYKRIAFLKAVGSGVVSPRSGFRITKKFLSLLESNGFHLIDTPATPVAERMWYINHAEHVFITWGTLGDTMLTLRVENVTAMSVRILYHTGYLDEMGLAKRLMKQKKLLVNVRPRGNRTWVMDMTRAVDHLSRNSVVYFRSLKMVKIGNDDLDELEPGDLFGAPGPG